MAHFSWGRLFDKSLIDQIKKQTLLDLSFLPGGNDLSLQQTSSFLPLDNHLFQSKQLILDINGAPGFTIVMLTPRSIFQLGRQASRNVAMALLASGLILSVVFFLYGEKGIVSHLIRMSAQADAIANAGNVGQRLEVGGSRELQRMGNAVNNMLASLEQAHKEVQERELKFRTVLEQSSDAILLYDPALEQIIDANQTFFRITGYQPEDLTRFSISHFLLMNEKLAPMLRIIRKRQHIHLTNIHCRCKNGTIREMDIASSLLDLNGRTIISAILRDMTERNHEQRMIKEMAVTDALTGIPNRRHLMERGVQELERLKRLQKRQNTPCIFACIMLDIDFFKLINDTHGHQCGDMVIKELARRMTECVRPYDVIGRYGGEEFAIFLTDTTGDQAMIIAQRVWQKIRSIPFSIGQLTIPVTVSLGISYILAPDEGLDDILKRADLALYEAKKNGRDQISLIA